jgi:CheY-like chemotaxis protein
MAEESGRKEKRPGALVSISRFNEAGSMMDPLILIVDDSPDGTMLTELAVTQLALGIRTQCVSGGKKAVELLASSENPPDLVFLDLKMPGMDGIDTLRRIRSDTRLRTLPVVITTLSTLESDEEAAHKAGASGFIYKAIRFSDFSRDIELQVKKWIRQRRSDEAGRSGEF